MIPLDLNPLTYLTQGGLIIYAMVQLYKLRQTVSKAKEAEQLEKAESKIYQLEWQLMTTRSEAEYYKGLVCLSELIYAAPAQELFRVSMCKVPNKASQLKIFVGEKVFTVKEFYKFLAENHLRLLLPIPPAGTRQASAESRLLTYLTQMVMGQEVNLKLGIAATSTFSGGSEMSSYWTTYPAQEVYKHYHSVFEKLGVYDLPTLQPYIHSQTISFDSLVYELENNERTTLLNKTTNNIIGRAKAEASYEASCVDPTAESVYNEDEYYW